MPTKSWDALGLSAVLRETQVAPHAAIDEQRGSFDVVGIARGEPHRGTCDVDRFTDPLVGNERHQLVIRFLGLPSRGIDRRTDSPRCDAVDANATRSKLLSQ